MIRALLDLNLSSTFCIFDEMHKNKYNEYGILNKCWF